MCVCVCVRIGGCGCGCGWGLGKGQGRSVLTFVASGNVDKEGRESAKVSMGADRKAVRNTRVAAHSSSVIFVSLRTAASAEAPLTPMPLP